MKEKNKVIKKIINSLNANDLDYARKLIERDLKRLNCDDEYYFYSALITSDMKEKKALYTKAIEANNSFLDAYINRGLVNNELGNYEESIEDYNRAIDIDKKCALAFNNRGYTKYKQGDFQGALADYNKAIILNPKFQMAIDNKALLFSKACMKDDEDFSEKFYLSLGISEINEGNFVEAIRDFDESLKYNKNSALTYFYKAIAFQSISKDKDAYDNYTKAIQLNKNMTDAYFNRGQLTIKTNPKEALDDFVKAVALDPKFIDAYYSIAIVQKNLGHYEDALKNLDKIIAIEPQAVNAKALKKLIQSKYL